MSVDIEALVKQAEADGVQKYVVGAYVMRGNELLLLKRAPGEDFLPDLVELPSGGVDPGETLIQGLEREIIEETGLTITSVDRYINFFDYLSGSGKRARQFNFAVTVATPFELKLNPAEHVEHYWVVPTAENLDNHFNLSDKTRKTILEASSTLLLQAA